jgi:hypothetical protein
MLIPISFSLYLLTPSRKPNWSPTKWVYLFVRYVPLLFQVCVDYFLQSPPPCPHIVHSAILLGGVTVASPNCRLWYILEACFMQVTISAVDVILMLRGKCVTLPWSRHNLTPVHSICTLLGLEVDPPFLGCSVSVGAEHDARGARGLHPEDDLPPRPGLVRGRPPSA